MTFYKIVVAYDGTDYHGWQFQPNATTISQTLTDAFASVFFQKVSILGASRTDTGVHALGQVAIVQSPIFVDCSTLLRAWSKALPANIVIKSIVHLDALIHPHDGVIQKTYVYHFFTKRPMPFVARYGWYIHRKVDLDLLRRALNVFVGTHDFRSFCSGDDLKDTVKTIDSVDLNYFPEWDAYKIEVKGRSFLRYMVRRIVGACLEIASREHLTLKDLILVLEQLNPCHTLPNAPAKGLLLESIKYQETGDLNAKN
jgi:tRNA pseudouridine38-40 synthase